MNTYRSKSFDAHIHVGYFPRKDGKGGETYYYSPARVMEYMRWTGVDEFIFSSTNACWDAHGESMHPEAAELRRLAGTRAHPFFWCSLEYIQWDRDLTRLPDFYEGIKLHGGEAKWNEHKPELGRILDIARERRLPVQIHTGNDDANCCSFYAPFCKARPDMRIDLAHGKRVVAAIEVLRECPNVYVDVSFAEETSIPSLFEVAPERVMYGSDFPAMLRYWDSSATEYMRKRIAAVRKIGGDDLLWNNARRFLNLA